MEFNSFAFLFFILPTLLIYFRLGHRGQNLFLVGASYFFYGSWDWRFLTLIGASTFVDYFCAKRMEGADNKKLFLWISLVFNLGLLGVFKYYGFFTQSLVEFLRAFQLEFPVPLVEIILPVGISFYTFQTLSYTMDVYQGKTKACQNFLDFALYVSFFPQLVAGPIEKSHHFLPQILQKRKPTLEGFYEGSWLIFWGLYKKIFVADHCAKIVDQVFHRGELSELGGMNLLLGSYAFCWQIYGDFSGYSDIARGISKIMGFDLMINFRQPFFSKNLSEFWRRWHISLSEWFRDYLYIPLGGNRLGKKRLYFNLFFVFLVSGLWHGAHAKYVWWGAFHGLGLIGLLLLTPAVEALKPKISSRLWSFFSVLLTFHFVAWTFALWQMDSMAEFIVYCKQLVFHFAPTGRAMTHLGQLIGFTVLIFLVQLWQNWGAKPRCVSDLKVGWRAFLYFLILFCLLKLRVIEGSQFIYFQF